MKPWQNRRKFTTQWLNMDTNKHLWVCYMSREWRVCVFLHKIFENKYFLSVNKDDEGSGCVCGDVSDGLPTILLELESGFCIISFWDLVSNPFTVLPAFQVVFFKNLSAPSNISFPMVPRAQRLGVFLNLLYVSYLQAWFAIALAFQRASIFTLVVPLPCFTYGVLITPSFLPLQSLFYVSW